MAIRIGYDTATAATSVVVVSTWTGDTLDAFEETHDGAVVVTWQEGESPSQSTTIESADVDDLLAFLQARRGT